MEDAGIGKDQLAGIGVGCPGPLDLNQGSIREAPNLGWVDVPIKQHLQKHFGCEAVIANDVDAGVFGEYAFGAAKKSRCVVGVFPGTGIGGGCVYEGKIFHGANCTCMEIGHIPLVSDGPMDGCGNVGTLESIASRLAISSSAAQAAYRGQAPALRESCGTDISDIRSGALASSIEAGDQMVKEIVEHGCRLFGPGRRHSGPFAGSRHDCARRWTCRGDAGSFCRTRGRAGAETGVAQLSRCIQSRRRRTG